MERVSIEVKAVPCAVREFDARDYEPIETISSIYLGDKIAVLHADVKDCKIYLNGELISYDEFMDMYNEYLNNIPLPNIGLGLGGM
jgi:hypothetical protein